MWYFDAKTRKVLTKLGWIGPINRFYIPYWTVSLPLRTLIPFIQNEELCPGIQLWCAKRSGVGFQRAAENLTLTLIIVMTLDKLPLWAMAHSSREARMPTPWVSEQVKWDNMCTSAWHREKHKNFLKFFLFLRKKTYDTGLKISCFCTWLSTLALHHLCFMYCPGNAL